MVAKRSEDRFSSMSDVIAVLSDSLNDLSFEDEVVADVSPLARIAVSSLDDVDLPSFFQNLAADSVQTSVSANVYLLEEEPTTGPDARQKIDTVLTAGKKFKSVEDLLTELSQKERQ